MVDLALKSSKRTDNGHLQDLPLLEAALNGVDFSTHPWLGRLPSGFAARMRQSPRLKKRLYSQLTTTYGDPKGDHDVAVFLSLDASAIKRAAVCVGLAYHLSNLGTALDAASAENLKNRFGEDALQFAIRHAPPVANSTGPRSGDDFNLENLVEPDGLSILKLWADTKGLHSAWVGNRLDSAQDGSLSMKPFGIMPLVGLALKEALHRRNSP